MEQSGVLDFFWEVEGCFAEKELKAFADRLATSRLPPVAAPRKRDYWEHFFLQILTPFELGFIKPLSPEFSSLAETFSSLNDYTSAKALSLAMEETALALLPEPRKTGLGELLLKIHPAVLKLVTHPGVAKRVRENPNGSVEWLAADYRLNPWLPARVLNAMGFRAYFSKNAARAASARAGGDFSDFRAWRSACDSLNTAENPNAGHRLNLLGDLLFESEKTDATRISLNLFPSENFAIGEASLKVERNAALGLFGKISSADLLRYVCRKCGLDDTGGFYEPKNFASLYKSNFAPLDQENPGKDETKSGKDSPGFENRAKDVLFWKILRELLGRMEMFSTEIDRIRFDHPECIFKQFKHLFINEVRECFYVLALDNKYQLLAVDLVGKGLVNQVLAHPREVFATPMKVRASHVVLLHNHPSGVPTPSQYDQKLTKELVDAAKILRIKILDHVIFGDGFFFSFADSKLCAIADEPEPKGKRPSPR